MRVNTDDALMGSTVSISEQLRDSLKTSSIVPGSITVTAPTTFRVEGVPQASDAQFRAAADEIAGTNYNRNPLAGGSYEFVMKPLIERDLREQTVEQAMQTIDRRVNELGVTEPTIARQSGKEQLIVQMPGLTDVARAKEIIRSTAILEFRLVEAGPAPKEELLKQFNGTLPGDMEILPGSPSSSPGAGASSTFYVRQEDRAGDRPGPPGGPARARRKQPARRALRAEIGRRDEVRQAVGREHRPLSRHRARQESRLGAEARRAHHRLRGGSAAASRRRAPTTSR